MNYTFSHRLEARFRDCDAMGHVNNAVYLTYLEQARLAHWRKLWSFRQPGEGSTGQPGIILARMEVDYKRPATYGETLDVRLAVVAVGRSSFTYEYEIVDADERLVASARSVQVAYDYAAGRPMPIPDAMRAALR